MFNRETTPADDLDVTTGPDRRSRRQRDGIWRALEDRGVPACTIDDRGFVLDANEPLCALLRNESEHLVGHQLTTAIGADDETGLISAIDTVSTSPTGVAEFVTSARLESGGQFELIASITEGPEPGLLICIMEDLTPRRRREIHRRRASLELVRRATTDPLTGLDNRSKFLAQLESALRRAQRQNATFTLLYCDLDGFKDVNDRFGHQAGDQVLKVVAERVRSATRDEDIVGRIGGDEFCVIADDLDALGAERIIQRIVTAVREPITIGAVGGGNRAATYAQVIDVGVSIGMATSDGSDLALDLLSAADEGMYQQKRRAKTALSRRSPPSEAR